MNKRLLFCIVVLNLGLVFQVKSQNADVRLLQNINGPQTKFDPLWKTFTHSVTPIALAVPVGYLSQGLYNHNKLQQKQGLAMVGGLALNTLFTVGLKYSINRDRPFKTHSDIIQKTSAGSPSFPSGHTSLAFATATNITLAYPHWYVAVPAYAWAGCVGYSRMHLGVHYPSDVLVGALIGTASSLLCWQLQKKLQ